MNKITQLELENEKLLSKIEQNNLIIKELKLFPKHLSINFEVATEDGELEIFETYESARDFYLTQKKCCTLFLCVVDDEARQYFSIDFDDFKWLKNI